MQAHCSLGSSPAGPCLSLPQPPAPPPPPPPRLQSQTPKRPHKRRRGLHGPARRPVPIRPATLIWSNALIAATGEAGAPAQAFLGTAPGKAANADDRLRVSPPAGDAAGPVCLGITEEDDGTGRFSAGVACASKTVDALRFQNRALRPSPPALVPVGRMAVDGGGCLQASGSNVAVASAASCAGEGAQFWARTDGGIESVGDPGLCLSYDAAANGVGGTVSMRACDFGRGRKEAQQFSAAAGIHVASGRCLRVEGPSLVAAVCGDDAGGGSNVAFVAAPPPPPRR